VSIHLSGRGEDPYLEFTFEVSMGFIEFLQFPVATYFPKI